MPKQIQIKTKLGYKITISIFKPNKVKGIVIINSATGVKQKYYKDFSLFLKSNDYLVYTYDYNGIGLSNSKNIKKIKSSAYDWGNNDFNSVLDYAINKNPNKYLTVIGHSIGGQLIGLASNSIKINTILLVASQNGYWKLNSRFERIKMFLFWYLILPIFVSTFGYLPAKKISKMENLPKNMTLEWKNWCKNPNYLFACLKDEQLYFNRIKADLISYSTEFDNYASKNAVDWITKKYSNSKSTRKHLKPKDLNTSKIGHFGFFKKEFKNPIWNMFLKNLNSYSLK